MDELELAKKGEWYNPNYNEDVILKRTYMQDLCYTYNNLLPSMLEERKDLLKEMIHTKTNDFLIEQPFYADYGINIKIGDKFYSNHNLTILDAAEVTFGNNCFIGPNCSFYTSIHPFDYKKRNEGLEQAKPITIGDNVWIGGSVSVLPGVHVGSNTVIGAGSIVTKDIPDNVIAVGNPCKVVKTIEEGIKNERK